MKEQKRTSNAGIHEGQSIKRKGPPTGAAGSTTEEITITADESVIALLKESQLRFDHLFILLCLHHKKKTLLDIFFSGAICLELSEAVQFLIEQGFIAKIINIKDDYRINDKGSDFLTALFRINITPVTDPPTKKWDEQFEEWWSTYPRTATWVADNGHMFISGRVLHTGTKKENRKLYLALLEEGIFTHEQLIASLKCEIAAKKKQSLLKNENALNYMKGSHSYLMCRYFENFMGLIDSGILNEEPSSSWEAG